MKLHRLEIEGFGPFLERQTVDFDAFDSAGLFLIAGRTGAGKSSILDGVCYALYGTVPRYDGGDRGLRSDHAGPHEPTTARLEFTATDRRWRITRTPEHERPKARGTGMTVAKATVLLEELVGDTWHGRATKAREVGDLLGEIVGLDRDQFQQVILLAQNRFAEFLLAGNADRQALLRTLFGSRRYADHQQAFDGRRRAAQQALDTGTAQADAVLAQAEELVAGHELGPAARDGEAPIEDAAASGVSDAAGPPASRAERIEAVERAVLRAGYRAEESVRLRDAAREQHDAALDRLTAQRTLHDKQRARLASRAVLADLERDAPAVATDRDRLSRARAAEVVRAPIESAARAIEAADTARVAERHVRERWAVRGEADLPLAETRALVSDLARDLAVWAEVAAIERELPQIEAERRGASDEVAAADRALEELAAAQSERTARIVAADAELAVSRSSAPALAPAQKTLATIAERLGAAREAARLAPRERSCEQAHLDAVRTHERAVAAVRELLQRRLDGYAGELAATLTDGEPCAVCGATAHPHPAAGSAEPVTPDAIADAEQAAEAARGAAERAGDAAAEARRAHHDAVARAAGESLEQLTAAHVNAEQQVAEALAAAEQIEALTRELARLRELDSTAAAERDTCRAAHTVAVQRLAAAEQRETTARATVAAARGDAATVTGRIADARERHDLAGEIVTTIEERQRRDEAEAEAVADRDARLASTDFADAASASVALVPAATQTVLTERVRAHELALAGERERLLALESELAGVADDPVDVDESVRAVARARDALHAAEAAAARDTEVAAQLSRTVGGAADAAVVVAARNDEYELIAGLANALVGRNDARMDLETFVLAAELEEIVVAANLRLEVMSEGRYRLQHTDAVGARRVASGLGLSVFDAYTGQSRAPQSLSGGETFLASLALALGLAEVVTARAGGVRLDTLFIDEGFGSLDADTLELAMQTLDELRQGGRTVGLISHVEAMKDALPAQLVVEATPRGPSVIRQPVGAG